MANQSLRDTLHAFFARPLAAGLAQIAPLGLLATGIGATLGAVIALPAFATSGLGIVLGSVAVNLASELIQQIVAAPDDATRGMRVQQGLAQGDADVSALAAATLAYAGPDIAAALPLAQRDTLLKGLLDGMNAAGGTLAVLAPRYGAALRDPNADWAALRAELAGDIETMRQVMVASNIRNSPMTMEGRARTMVQNMRATGDIEGSSMTMIGGHSRSRNAEQPQPLNATTTEPEHLRALIAIRRRNLAHLEQREARAGGNVPVELFNALRDERAAIAALEQRLQASPL